MDANLLHNARDLRAAAQWLVVLYLSSFTPSDSHPLLPWERVAVWLTYSSANNWLNCEC